MSGTKRQRSLIRPGLSIGRRPDTQGLSPWFSFAALLPLVWLATIPARASERYVSANNLAAAAPYTNWAAAAATIQDAVDLANAGDTIWVTNGVYETGVRVVNSMSNRVAVTKALTVQSVNGPGATTIRGYPVPGATNGAAAVRCVYLASGAILAGFTLTGGATQATGDPYKQQSGGGVWCESTDAMVSNCVVAACSAVTYGGGAFMGTLEDCTLINNQATNGGGAVWSTLTNCTLAGNAASNQGGGAYMSTLNSCTLSNNLASNGGGVAASTLDSCTLIRNAASFLGGGSSGGILNTCTLIANSAAHGGGGSAGGTLNNCSLTGNSATQGGGACGSTLNNCTAIYNSATATGGGAYGGTLINSVLLYNNARINPNSDSATFNE